MLRHASLCIAMFLSTCFAGHVAAAQNDLGSSRPNTDDLSLSPYWHVYVFHQNGIEYIQINDLNGVVREVVAAANGNFLILPMGLDAARVVTPQQPLLSKASGVSSQVVYRDASIKVAVSVGANGTLYWTNNSNGINADTCGPPECVSQQQPQPK